MLRRFPILAVAALAIAGSATACQKDTTGNDAQLRQIDQRLARIEASLRSGAAARPAGARANVAPRANAPRPRPPGPDPRAVYSVPIDGNAFKGAKHAKVTVVKGYEYACPFCQRVNPTIDQLLSDYKDDIKVVYKQYVVHPSVATTPALAACAATRQNKFAQMSELIWTKGYNAGRNLGQENMETLARELGLDMKKFKADMAGACKQLVQKDQTELSRVGTRGTPAFYINGRFLSGARPIDQFKTIIDEELKKANDRVAKGERVETYYDKFVVNGGKKTL